MISTEGRQEEISYLGADRTRVLVDVPINLTHNNIQIVELYDKKITTYINCLSSSLLKPYDILFGYQHYWWPSLKYPASLLSLDQDVNVLSNLYAALLPKLGVMKTFSTILRTFPIFLGGLNLY